MIVDDCHDNADCMAWMLRCEHHLVVVAYDGESALKLAAEFRPDMAFIDIGMPKMNGIELAEKLLTLDEGMYLVAVSGHTAGKYLQQWEERIGTEYLIKPTAPKTILAMIAERTEAQR